MRFEILRDELAESEKEKVTKEEGLETKKP